MSISSVIIATFMALLSLLGSLGLLAFAMDVVSMPDPMQIKVEYARPYHVHNLNHVADERSTAP